MHSVTLEVYTECDTINDEVDWGSTSDTLHELDAIVNDAVIDWGSMYNNALHDEDASAIDNVFD